MPASSTAFAAWALSESIHDSWLLHTGILESGHSYFPELGWLGIIGIALGSLGIAIPTDPRGMEPATSDINIRVKTFRFYLDKKGKCCRISVYTV